jgi:hypothetical protein
MITLNGLLKSGQLKLDQSIDLPDGEVRLTIETLSIDREFDPEQPQLGTLRGTVLSIADDFDAIPEGLEV